MKVTTDSIVAQMLKCAHEHARLARHLYWQEPMVVGVTPTDLAEVVGWYCPECLAIIQWEERT
jgi:hypothetical protein